MRPETVTDLAEDLDALPDDVVAALEQFGFDRQWFLAEAGRHQPDAEPDNTVSGVVEPPAAGDVVDLPPYGSPEHAALRAAGEAALAAGELALVVLAGGMATRMGGVVKALVEALPGQTFLDLRLAEQEALEERLGRPVPMWLMTSHATDSAIKAALGDRLDGYRVATFPQRVSLRLAAGGGLFRDGEGRISEHAPGHGDLPDALVDSGLLDSFLTNGGRYLMVANLDNLGATLDPLVVGCHVSSGKALTCEVVDKVGSDRGGIPVRLDGRPLILEEFRLPAAFDATEVGVFNTNTFHFDAHQLRHLDMPWTYFKVRKEVDGQPVFQFERLVNEVAAHVDTTFLRVPRTGPETRFLPIKDNDDLARLRPDITAVARDRGMIR